MPLIPLVLFLLILFIGFVVVLRAILIRYSTQATGHLQQLTQEAAAQEQVLRKKIEAADARAQEQMAKATEEAQQAKQRLLQEAEQARQQLVDQARQEGERIVAQAMQAREALQREMTRLIEQRATERACELLQEALPEPLRKATHTQWMDDLLQNGWISTDRLETQEEIREARVVSAFPLTATQRKTLLERLQAAVGSPLTVQESVDPKIVAGVTITLGHLVLDGSLVSKLQEAARRAADAHAE